MLSKVKYCPDCNNQCEYNYKEDYWYCPICGQTDKIKSDNDNPSYIA